MGKEVFHKSNFKEKIFVGKNEKYFYSRKKYF